MHSHVERLVATLAIAAFLQAGCYNTYRISKGELEKLESGVEQKQVVKVKSTGGEDVPVSTANALNVVSNDGEKHRVTPFHFMMSEDQIVSPEYDLLLSTDDVEGAQVREFSTWKTVGMIAGVTLGTIGTFVGIGLLAPEGEGFN